jgi:rare lipoprotein A (peptidoglycan hydrolase)
MHERAGTRPGSTPLLRLFALATLSGAIFPIGAPYVALLTTTPKADKPATIAEPPPEPDRSAARVVASAEMQSTKPESVTARAQVQPTDVSQTLKTAPAPKAPSSKEEKSVSAEAEVLPLPQTAPEQGLAMLIPPVPPLPERSPQKARSAIANSEAPPLPTRAPKEVRSKLAGSPLQQTGRASWYALDSLTASGEKLDHAGLTAAHNDLPFDSNVRIENIANGRSVVVRINDRGPFVAGRIYRSVESRGRGARHDYRGCGRCAPQRGLR